jgi:hypothetical protein
MMCHLL